MALLIIFLICLGIYIGVKDTLIEEKLKNKCKEIIPTFKKISSNIFISIKSIFLLIFESINRKLHSNKWKYFNSWCSKGGIILYVKYINPYDETKIVKYVNWNGWNFQHPDGHYVTDSEELLNKYELQNLWRDCMANSKYKDE